MRVPTPTSAGTDDGELNESTTDGSPTRLLASERGQAEQIDFLNGMIIFLFGLGLFFASGSVLFAVGVDSEPDLETAAHNADQRLVDDIFVTTPGGIPANLSCVAAYFAMEEHDRCGLRPATFDTAAPTESHWLRRSLGLGPDLDVNVTIRTGDGQMTLPDGTPATLGPSVPHDGEVAHSSRFVRVGKNEYRTVFVRVW